MNKDAQVTPSEMLKKINTVLASKKWKSLNFLRGRSLISMGVEIDTDIDNPDDWMFHILAVMDVERPEHEHFTLTEAEAKKLRDYLDRYLEHVSQLKQKRKQRKKK